MSLKLLKLRIRNQCHQKVLVHFRRWIQDASSWAPECKMPAVEPQLCLLWVLRWSYETSWSCIYTVFQQAWMRATIHKLGPQLEDLQVCFLRFTLNIKVWIIIQILRSQNQSPKSFLGKSWSRMWATRFIQIRQSFHGQIPLMRVTSTSNAATGRYLAPIVERCKL